MEGKEWEARRSRSGQEPLGSEPPEGSKTELCFDLLLSSQKEKAHHMESVPHACRRSTGQTAPAVCFPLTCRLHQLKHCPTPPNPTAARVPCLDFGRLAAL
jgi:hypothetical protein